ncbi:MAG: DUF6702 family protein [Pseudomonadota bacterium]
MRLKRAWLSYVLVVAAVFPASTIAHPLELSLTEIEYSDDQQLLTVSLRLFLMDVNEALVFDPESTALAFCQPNESPEAEPLLLEYLEELFYIKVNGEKLKLEIDSKRLSGEGINIALVLDFVYRLEPPLKTLEIKNAVFTNLFFNQNNIVYLHVNGENRSLMLSKKTPSHRLAF